MSKDTDDTDGKGEQDQNQVSQPENEDGQSTPSPREPETAHEKIMAGVATLRAEEEAEKAKGEGAAEQKADSEGDEEGKAAGGTPSEKEEAPGEGKPAPAAEPTVAELRQQVKELQERIPGFQTALNEKDEALKAERATNLALRGDVDAMLELVEQGLPEEERQQFRQQFQQRSRQHLGQYMAQERVAVGASKVEGLLGRLEKAGMTLEGATIGERIRSAAQQGIDIGPPTQDPGETLFHLGQSVTAYEAAAATKAQNDELKALKAELEELKKQGKKKERDDAMRRGEGATNLSGGHGAGFEREGAKPRELIAAGIEARKAAGEW